MKQGYFVKVQKLSNHLHCIRPERLLTVYSHYLQAHTVKALKCTEIETAQTTHTDVSEHAQRKRIYHIPCDRIKSSECTHQDLTCQIYFRDDHICRKTAVKSISAD